MEIKQYSDEYKEEVIGLILDIQNNEAKVGIPLAEQPDLLDICTSYIGNGGNFWIAVDNNHVVGTIGLMKINPDWCVLKKFFVRRDFRSRKVGLALYERLLAYAETNAIKHIILDTPSVATKSHAFYERAGFVRIDKSDLPIAYEYPDRQSVLYRLDLQ